MNLMAFGGKPALECGDRMSGGGISLLLELIVKKGRMRRTRTKATEFLHRSF